jgi:hypothetical protein
MVHFPLSPSPVTGRKPAVVQPFPTPSQQVALAYHELDRAANGPNQIRALVMRGCGPGRAAVRPNRASKSSGRFQPSRRTRPSILVVTAMCPLLMGSAVGRTAKRCGRDLFLGSCQSQNPTSSRMQHGFDPVRDQSVSRQ